MNKSICKKVVSMLSLYIENKLNEDDKFFVENHFLHCSDCYEKYLEMKEIINNLHFEYQKLINEFERIEANKMFNIREYEMFYQNISPYIDDELCYDESIKFRKYLLKSKPARAELASAYGLKNSIKNSVTTFKDNLNINYAKKIIKRLREDNKYSFENIYTRAALVIGFMVSFLIVWSLFISISFINNHYIKAHAAEISDIINFPQDEDWVQFYFDETGSAILSLK